MHLAAAFGSASAVYLNAVAVVMCLGSLSIVVSAFVWVSNGRGPCGARDGAVPLIAAGLLDGITYRYLFRSFIVTVWANPFGGISAHSGAAPIYHYVDLAAHYLGGVLALRAMAIVLAGLGANRAASGRSPRRGKLRPSPMPAALGPMGSTVPRRRQGSLQP